MKIDGKYNAIHEDSERESARKKCLPSRKSNGKKACEANLDGNKTIKRNGEAADDDNGEDVDVDWRRISARQRFLRQSAFKLLLSIFALENVSCSYTSSHLFIRIVITFLFQFRISLSFSSTPHIFLYDFFHATLFIHSKHIRINIKLIQLILCKKNKQTKNINK